MSAEAEIHRRITARGPITFAEFMDVALYHHDGGYYTSRDPVGSEGDFYTSPSVHPAFGALLAVQLFQMWELLEHPSTFTVVEPGAGSGLLCRDIMSAAASLPDGFAQSLRYVCLDRRAFPGHEAILPGVSRVASPGIPLRGIVGCVLSNELLDAMPVHQVTVSRGELREVYVGLDGGRIVERVGEPSTRRLSQRLAELAIELREGQTAEINLALDDWVRSAAQSLDRGFVLTIDYGCPADELYSAIDRFGGTLTTFHRHLQTDRPLERIGQQDMSAQVDVTTLARAGARSGLRFLDYANQAAFLRNLGLARLAQRPPVGPPRLAQSSLVGMRELAKPDGLGDFKVMAHGKKVESPELWGFHLLGSSLDLLERLPPIVPTAEHLDLLTGRYPQQDIEIEVPWERLWRDDSP